MKEAQKLKLIIDKACEVWKSPPDFTVSQWADENRYLSPEAAAEPGKWKTSSAEYQRGIMDAFSDPDTELIVIMSSAQIGKTEQLNNIVGFFIDQDPSPILVVQPTLEMAKTWSKDRLSNMLRDCPCFKGKIKNPRSRDSNNTIFHKEFSGGHITIVGANAAAGLASRPIRVVLCDEVDRYPESAGTEGDPVNLAFKRTATFYNRKKALVSTPGIKGASRIEKAFEETDKRYYHVPCPECGKFQKLRWKQVKFDKLNPENAYYECGHCQAKLSDVDRYRAIKKGKWIAEAEFKGSAGFHLNALYSPWTTISEIVKEFLEAQKDTERLKTWVNTTLGETWEEEGDTVDETLLMRRVEAYPATVPAKALVLTAGADVQADRIEVEVVGWGKDNESWSVEYKVFYGDTSQQSNQVWKDFDDYLYTDFTHETGAKLSISFTCVDSGYNTNEVYDFCRTRASRRIYAIKGQSGASVPIAGRASKLRYGKPKKTVQVFPLGVDQAKTVVYANLKKTEQGAGYCHFPNSYTAHYFDMLTAEKAVTKYVKGFKKIEWQKIRERNEALDCRVYALAGFKILSPSLDRIAERMQVKDESENPVNDEVVEKEESKPAKRKKRKGGFVNGWR